ncbi:hypothetical protein [Trinickia terrae]|uniref:hypothetical protein n=1 Tax=Trinickia terrae TaxID=2571161 RepID=UPI00146BCB12|nr:hypothetical protein [Trinickia terrae]
MSLSVDAARGGVVGTVLREQVQGVGATDGGRSEAGAGPGASRNRQSAARMIHAPA